jgi:opacity protein-like surface antigen
MRDVRLISFVILLNFFIPCYADFHHLNNPWYVKGSLGYSHSNSARFTDTHPHASTPPDLFGPSRSAQGHFGSSALVEAGLGYRLTDAIRAELLFDYQPHFQYSGNANFVRSGDSQPVSADVNSNSLFAAGFIDLPALSPTVRPFIGAGVGMAYQHVTGVLFKFPFLSPTPTQPAITRTVGGNYIGLAYMVSAGVAWELTKNITMDVAYRYTDLGQVQTSAGPANVDWHPHGRPPHLLTVNSITAPLRTQNVLLSLRYSF